MSVVGGVLESVRFSVFVYLLALFYWVVGYSLFEFEFREGSIFCLSCLLLWFTDYD